MVPAAGFATAYQAYDRFEFKFVSFANTNAPPRFPADPVMPELSVKSPFNLYHATKFVHSVEMLHAAAEVAPAAEVVPEGHARQSDVRFTQLFSCADAWAKTSFDRCVFQIYSLENCQSLFS